MTSTPTPAAPVSITAETFVSRVRAVLRAGGAPRGWPKRQLDRWILLHAVGRRIGPAEELPEREANARIQNWLLGPGGVLGVDFVTLRRMLVDEGFWDREDGGTRYRRSPRHERRVRFDTDLPDELDILTAAERDAAGRREEYRGRAGR
ncbi:MAG: DUF2087 domain-containing protein [Candidatus Eisenbacteria bacterium]